MSEAVSDALARAPLRWRNLAVLKHGLMHDLDALVKGGCRLEQAAQFLIDDRFQFQTYTGMENGAKTTYVFKVSVASVKRWWSEWNATRCVTVFLPDYKPGQRKIQDELVLELLSRRTREGMRNDSAAIQSLIDDWRKGRSIPGYGTWQEWWTAAHADLPLPHRAPDFPVSVRTMHRVLQSRKLLKALGTQGRFAAKLEQPFISRDYATLRPFELFTADDVRIDIAAIDLDTGRVTTVTVYLMMEVSCRFICAYVLRPANAVNSGDVKAMLARGLGVTGIGQDYSTHILLERGTTALSTDDQLFIETQSGHRIEIHRTSMIKGAKHPGAFRDAPSGNFMGKAVIESFIRKLHLALLPLRGQRGNRYDNMPENLGVIGEGKTAPGSQAREAEVLASLQAKVNALTNDPKLRVQFDFPLLTIPQLNAAIRQAIAAHNDNADHRYEGFGYSVEQQTGPGVWEQRSVHPGGNHQ